MRYLGLVRIRIMNILIENVALGRLSRARYLQPAIGTFTTYIQPNL